MIESHDQLGMRQLFELYLIIFFLVVVRAQSCMIVKPRVPAVQVVAFREGSSATRGIRLNAGIVIIRSIELIARAILRTQFSNRTPEEQAGPRFAAGGLCLCEK